MCLIPISGFQGISRRWRQRPTVNAFAKTAIVYETEAHAFRRWVLSQVNETTLCVKNVGPGVARKIEFRDNLSFAPYGGEPLESIGFLKNGIDVLAPGQERRQNQPSVADPFGDLSQLQVTIPVNYEDSRGTKYSDAFSLDFTEPDLLPTQGDP